jgi:transcription-repair coupling factor (superfamily II helicase)
LYYPGKVTVRGLGAFKAAQQLQNLIDAFRRMQGAIPEAAMLVSIFLQTSSTGL